MDGPDWKVETTNCPLCASTEFCATPYRQDPFAVKQCADCSFYYLSPRLTAEAATNFYQSDDYFSGGDGQSGYEDYSVQEGSLRATFRKLLETIDNQGATGGGLLEVGCGPGYLLDEAQEYFESREGVELSPEAAESARIRTNVTIHHSNDEIDPASQFDCIIATHVIEHIYNPVEFVQGLAKHLKPEGSIVLAAPHMGSVFRHVMGKYWPSWKYPEHVSFFDANTLQDLFDRAGLEVVERVPYPHVFPLTLVLSKFGIPGAKWTNRINVTLPATTISFRAKHRGT